MTVVDRVRWSVRGKDARSGHSSAMGATEDDVHAPTSAAGRHEAHSESSSSVLDDIRAANDRYAASFSQGNLSPEPSRRLAVLTCMDARLDPLAALGLRLGEAHVIRNAGGLATDDALRSLVISSTLLGTEAALVVGHTDCGMTRFSNYELRQRLRDRGADADEIDFLPFPFVDARVAESVERLRDSPLLPASFEVHGLVFDVKTGHVRLVD